MKKIRDFFYSVSDIFVILVVLALAAGIIFWRVHDVMGYSEYAASKSGPETKIDIDFTDVDLNPEKDPSQETPELPPETDPEQKPDDNPEQDPQPEDDPEKEKKFKTSKEISLEIPRGTSSKKSGTLIAEKLGLSAEEKEVFVKEFLRIKDALGRTVMAGKYTIPAGSTIEDIVKIVAR